MTLPALIFAAHPDDELLGALELFEAGLVRAVIYAEVESSLAMEQGGRYECARRCVGALAPAADVLFGAEPPGVLAMRYADALAMRYADAPADVWVPDPTDDHPEHRHAQVYGLAVAEVLRVSPRFYSIQKRAPWRYARNDALVERARSLFAEHYPDQQDMLMDPAYFLFAGVPQQGDYAVEERCLVQPEPGVAVLVHRDLTAVVPAAMAAVRARYSQVFARAVAAAIRAASYGHPQRVTAEPVTARVGNEEVTL